MVRTWYPHTTRAEVPAIVRKPINTYHFHILVELKIPRDGVIRHQGGAIVQFLALVIGGLQNLSEVGHHPPPVVLSADLHQPGLAGQFDGHPRGRLDLDQLVLFPVGLVGVEGSEDVQPPPHHVVSPGGGDYYLVPFVEEVYVYRGRCCPDLSQNSLSVLLRWHIVYVLIELSHSLLSCARGMLSRNQYLT